MRNDFYFPLCCKSSEILSLAEQILVGGTQKSTASALKTKNECFRLEVILGQTTSSDSITLLCRHLPQGHLTGNQIDTEDFCLCEEIKWMNINLHIEFSSWMFQPTHCLFFFLSIRILMLAWSLCGIVLRFSSKGLMQRHCQRVRWLHL